MSERIVQTTWTDGGPHQPLPPPDDPQGDEIERLTARIADLEAKLETAWKERDHAERLAAKLADDIYGRYPGFGDEEDTVQSLATDLADFMGDDDTTREWVACVRQVTRNQTPDPLERLTARIAELTEASQAVLANLDHLRDVWGDEGVTRTVCDKLRKAIETPEPRP